MAPRKKNVTPAEKENLLTARRMEKFIGEVVRSGGNITAACRAVTDSEQDAFVLRRMIYHLEKSDEKFAEDFREAQRIGVEVLEDEAKRRAYDGVDEPVFYQGIATDTVKKYSNSLMMFLLKGGMPEKYKDRVEHTGDPNAPVHVDVKGTPLVNGFLSELGGSEKK